MAISTYSELLTAGGAWITNTDAETYFPECIALAEGVLNRELNCRQMYARSTSFTVDSVTESLPTRFGGVRAFYLNTTPPSPLIYVKADDFGDPREAGAKVNGKPEYYTIIGDLFVFAPTPDATYSATLAYRQLITPLTVSAPTNWLLTAFPDVYLSGMLAFAYQYLEDDAMEAKFMGNFMGAIGQINADDNRQAYGSAPSRRVRGFA